MLVGFLWTCGYALDLAVAHEFREDCSVAEHESRCGCVGLSGISPKPDNILARRIARERDHTIAQQITGHGAAFDAAEHGICRIARPTRLVDKLGERRVDQDFLPSASVTTVKAC